MEVKSGVKMEVKKDNCVSRSFRDLECWQQAHEFVKAVYSITKLFPEDERYGLSSQFRRAAVSIAANICEGYRKLSRADKLRFMNIAQGSLEECRYYIILSRDIEYIDKAAFDSLELLMELAGNPMAMPKPSAKTKEFPMNKQMSILTSTSVAS